MKANNFAAELESLSQLINRVGNKLNVNDPECLLEGGRVIQHLVKAREQMELMDQMLYRVYAVPLNLLGEQPRVTQPSYDVPMSPEVSPERPSPQTPKEALLRLAKAMESVGIGQLGKRGRS